MANSRFPKFGYGRSAVFAKGRMKAGMLNKTEQNYKEYLEQERQCGRVIAYWFEAIKLKGLAGTTLTSSFCVQMEIWSFTKSKVVHACLLMTQKLKRKPVQLFTRSECL